MSIGKQVAVLCLYYFLAFNLIRYLMFCIKGYLFNKSAYKKHKKGESFKEWLLYSRYYQIIPRKFLILYFVILVLHPIAILLCVVICCFPAYNIGSILVKIIVFFDIICFVTIVILVRFVNPRRLLPKKNGKGKQ